MQRIGCIIGFLILLSMGLAEPGFSQEEIFYDNFETRNVENWNLEEGWRVQHEQRNHFLKGKGHHWARLKIGQDWRNYRLITRLMLVDGGVHLNVRVSSEGRYFIGFRPGRIYLSKEAPWGTFSTLKEAEAGFDNNQWLDVEIVCDEGRIGISLSGRSVLEHQDRRPLSAGTIAFESLDRSEIIIDKVKIIGEQAAKPQAKGLTDLIIESLTVSAVQPVAGEEMAIFALVRNLGNQPVQNISVLFFIQEAHELRSKPIDSLQPGQAKIAKASGVFEVPGEKAVTAFVDPENHLHEMNEENNILTRQINLQEPDHSADPREPIVEYSEGRSLGLVSRNQLKELKLQPDPEKTPKSWDKMLSAKYSEVVEIGANQEKGYSLQLSKPGRIHLQIYYYSKEPEKLAVQLIHGKGSKPAWQKKGRQLYKNIGFINGQVSITPEMVESTSQWTIKVKNQTGDTSSAEVLITVAQSPGKSRP